MSVTDWLFALTWLMWLWWVMIPIDDFTDTFQYLLSFALFLWIDLLMNISNCKTNSIWKLQYSIFKENSLSSFLLHICMLLLWMCNFISLNPRRCLGFLVRLSAALEGDVAIRFASLFFHSFPSNLHIFRHASVSSTHPCQSGITVVLRRITAVLCRITIVLRRITVVLRP